MEEAYIINGLVCKVIPYGSETRANFAKHSEVCHDCSCKIGEYHMQGCDVEECPNCHCQLINCECNFE